MFDAEFRFARKETGETVESTHAESQILLFLAQHPQKVLTRQQILEGVFANNAASGDRSIDHLVNRIRKKLGDKATDSRFIGTRYGGGYFWVGQAPERTKSALPKCARIIIGPARGLGLLDGDTVAANRLLKLLAEAMRRHFRLEDAQVVIHREFDPDAAGLAANIDRYLLPHAEFSGRAQYQAGQT